MRRRYNYANHIACVEYGTLFRKRKPWARWKHRAHALATKAQRKGRIFYYVPVGYRGHARKPWAKRLMPYLIQDHLPV